MAKYLVSKERNIPPDEQKRRLAQCYDLILSWSEPTDQTADPEDFSENTEPAEANAPTIESDADSV